MSIYYIHSVSVRLFARSLIRPLVRSLYFVCYFRLSLAYYFKSNELMIEARCDSHVCAWSLVPYVYFSRYKYTLSYLSLVNGVLCVLADKHANCLFWFHFNVLRVYVLIIIIIRFIFIWSKDFAVRVCSHSMFIWVSGVFSSVSLCLNENRCTILA